MSFPDLKIIYQDYLETKLYLPYISGYLAFREVEPLMTLITRLKQSKPEIYPQVILVDGNGILHPRQFGNASHLGVLAQTPTIGVAKNFLVIKNELDYSPAFKAQLKQELVKRGDRFDLIGETSGRVYGAALINSERAMNPVFVSQGHGISLECALRIVVATSLYRIPEPIRSADLSSRSYIKSKGN
ncbi:endonuclease V [Backusella circina FSU 941]|nr:endonuclease V [Backusella circina FSU 941]